MKNYLRFLSPVMLLLMAVMFGGGKILAQTSEKFDFVGWSFTTENWGNNYAQHSVSGNVADVVFAGASKQTQTITDCPVTKGQPITVTLKDPNSYNITGVKLLLKQWNTNKQTVTLNVSANGKDFTSTSETSSTFELNASLLTTKALKFTFSNKASRGSQVGVQSIEIFYEKENGKTQTTLSFPTPSYTYEVGQENGTVIIDNNVAVLKNKEGNVISDATGKITYSVVPEDVASCDNENPSTILVDTSKEGTATVTATFDAAGTDEKYSTSTATYTIKVTKRQTTLSFGEAYDGKTINVNLGDEFTAPTATLTPNIEGATIKYSSNNSAVANVDETTGAVTIVGAGTTVITADFAGDDTYAASKASYTINVIKVITSIADLKKQGLSNEEQTFTLKLTDAVVSYVHGANAYIEDASAGILVYLPGKQTLVAGQKFNGLVDVVAVTWNSLPEIKSWTPSASMTTETVTELPLQVVTVEELINNYDKYEGRRVKVLGATVSKAFSNKNGEITQNGPSITLRAGDTTIKATRYDIVNVIGFPSVYEADNTRTIQLAIWEKSAIEVIKTETLKTSAKGYATYSADYAVNYSESGLTAYTLTVDETNKTVTAKEFTGVVPAGGAVLVKGDASKAYTLTPATTEGDATFVTNLQTGATTADGTQYGFTSKFGTPAFAQVASGQDIPAKKGYIVLSGASAAKYSICFGNETTGIQTIEAASAANAAMYNLAGQRVDKAYKGIVIVNGKKYLNK